VHCSPICGYNPSLIWAWEGGAADRHGERASELLTWVAMAERRCGSHEFVFSVVEKGVDEDSGNQKVVRFQGRLVGGGAGGRGR
jgi:hypothetical protein